MHPKKNIPLHLHKDIVYQWISPEETCNSSYIGESSRCLENRIKEHNNSTTSAIYQHNSTYNHPKADMSHFKNINQDSKQVSTEAREAIHIRRTNPGLNLNIGKTYLPNIFDQLLGATYNCSTDISTIPNIPQNTNNSSTGSSTKSNAPIFLPQSTALGY